MSRQEEKSAGNSLWKWCDACFLSFTRMKEWQDLHGQLLDACQRLHLRLNSTPATYAQGSESSVAKEDIKLSGYPLHQKSPMGNGIGTSNVEHRPHLIATVKLQFLSGIQSWPGSLFSYCKRVAVPRLQAAAAGLGALPPAACTALCSSGCQTWLV